MKKKKKLWKIIGGILIFIVVVIVVAIMLLGSIIAGTMRSVGTKATGTKLAVESVSLSLLRGNLSINKLAIDNPPDYKVKEAFSFDLVHVDLDVNSLFTDTIIVNKVEIANVKIDFEPTLKGGSNLDDIKNNIMKFIGADKAAEESNKESGKEPKEKEAESDTPKKEKKIIIKSFVINKGTIMVSSNLLKTTVQVPLARMELNDIGKDSEMAEALAEIYNEILKQVVTSVASADIKGLDIDAITKDLPNVAEKIAKDISKSIKELF